MMADRADGFLLPFGWCLAALAAILLVWMAVDLEQRGSIAWALVVIVIFGIVESLTGFVELSLMALSTATEAWRGAGESRPNKDVNGGGVGHADAHRNITPSISFSVCGLSIGFHVGVMEYILEHFDTSELEIVGTSGGVFPAACMALGRHPLEWMQSNYPGCLEYWGSRRFGLFLDTTEFMRRLWRNFLPEDAHKQLSGKLYINATRVPSSMFRPCPQALLHQYRDNDQLISSLLSSAHVPGMYRMFTTVDGVRYFDGGIRDLVPSLRPNTITVSPHCSADINPHITNNKRHSALFSVRNTLRVPTMQSCMQEMRAGYHSAAMADSKLMFRGWSRKIERERPKPSWIELKDPELNAEPAKGM
jgi:hypothetical protein